MQIKRTVNTVGVRDIWSFDPTCLPLTVYLMAFGASPESRTCLAELGPNAQLPVLAEMLQGAAWLALKLGSLQRLPACLLCCSDPFFMTYVWRPNSHIISKLTLLSSGRIRSENLAADRWSSTAVQASGSLLKLICLRALCCTQPNRVQRSHRTIGLASPCNSWVS